MLNIIFKENNMNTTSKIILAVIKINDNCVIIVKCVSLETIIDNRYILTLFINITKNNLLISVEDFNTYIYIHTRQDSDRYDLKVI